MLRIKIHLNIKILRLFKSSRFCNSRIRFDPECHVFHTKMCLRMYSLVRYDKLLYNKPDLQKINYVKWKKSKYTCIFI